MIKCRCFVVYASDCCSTGVATLHTLSVLSCMKTFVDCYMSKWLIYEVLNCVI